MNFDIGELYIVQFHDHSIGQPGETEFQLCGWIWAETDRYITINTWHMLNVDKDTEENNLEAQNIMKSAITRKRKIRVSL